MSRWGPPNAAPVKTESIPFRDDDNDFQMIDEVEWSDPDDRHATGELAKRPPLDKNSEFCGCAAEPEGCCRDESCVLFACQEECQNCRPNCCNQRIGRKQWKSVEVFDAGPKGRGLRAKEDIRKGEFIIEYVGRAIRKQYLEGLFRRYKTERMLYIMSLSNDVYIDARKKGCVARYINHSCQPNCKVDRWRVQGISRASIFAVRDIAKGEEFSFDYQWSRKKGRAPTKCHCLSPKCRGTLEVAKSLEDEELERKLSSHWKKHPIKNARREIINRSIRIMSNEYHEYFSADVCRYDDSTGKHLVIYRNSLDESWEDLSKEDWMILDEEAEQFVIGKKTKNRNNETNSSLGLIGTNLRNSQNQATAATGAQSLKDFKNYFYVTTAVKSELFGKGFIRKVQTRFHCTVEETRFIKPTQPPETISEEEAVTQKRVFQMATDGVIWRLTVTGVSLEQACSFLDLNVAKLSQRLSNPGGESQTSNGVGGGPPTEISGCIEDIVIPRIAVDAMKKRLPTIRERCRNVNVQFGYSESKSKKFAKLQLDGSTASDVEEAKRYLWKHMLESCTETGAPTTPLKLFKDLGFYGGELSSQHFRLLFNFEKDRMNLECGEELSRSAFFTSFESGKKCYIWVQAEEDMGRIDSQNRIVSEFNPHAPRKLYFGCDPSNVPQFFETIETRAKELASGIRYFHLGADHMFQQLMMKNQGKFFKYIHQISGATVTLDQITGDHLRIDGGALDSIIEIGNWDSEKRLTSSDRAILAEEMIRLQIELYRDHVIQKQSWVFGRDWSVQTTAKRESSSSDSKPMTPVRSSTPVRGGASSKHNKFERRQVVNACMELAEIVRKMDLEPGVAAHAVVILYRFLRVMEETDSNPSNLKIKEIALGCLFLANKSQQGTQRRAIEDAQKAKRMRRLEGLLESAYKVFYSGIRFDPKSPEVENLGQRVVLAETEILKALDYDVFWKGVNWIVRAAVEGARLDSKYAEATLEQTLSGPVLAAGEELWLRYGVDFIFVAVAGFLRYDIEPLFGTLSVLPIKVHQAAALIKHAILRNPSAKKTTYPLYQGGTETLDATLKNINAICMNATIRNADAQKDMSLLGETGQRYHIISQQTKRLAFKGVSKAILMDSILPNIDGISAESKCKIFVTESEKPGAEDLILEGGWRALAIAEHLLTSACTKNAGVLPTATDLITQYDGDSYKIQAKRKGGLLPMKNVDTSEGWEGTIQAKAIAGGQASGRKVGGKACVAGRLSENSLREVGLRWWIPSHYAASPSGSIYEMQCLRNIPPGEDARLNSLQEISDLAKAMLGEKMLTDRFPLLSSIPKKSSSNVKTGVERQVAVSMARWPPEKIASREQDKVKSKHLPVGFSPAALQEIQLLKELHSLIPSPEGHPNLVLPVAIALPQEESENVNELVKKDDKDDIFSLFRTSEENERRAQREKKRKDMATGPHILFDPAPFVLHRVMARSSKKKREESDLSISPSLLASWCHDLLTALVHCHTNNVLIRTLLTDQVIIDHSGVAKFAGFYRATVLSPFERTGVDQYRQARDSYKEKKRKGELDTANNELAATNPFVAPETLLGSPKHTKETDVWSIGAMMGNFLLGKNVFAGKDRASVLVSMFKIVGTPEKQNYEAAEKFPFFPKKHLKRRYRRNVEKAFAHMMKTEEYEKHEKAIALIAKMLHLDPEERISAKDALGHEYMSDYREQSNSNAFRAQYAKDWMLLKKKLAHSSRSDDDEAMERERVHKRKLMLEAAQGDGIDELYDLGELMASTKKIRTEEF